MINVRDTAKTHAVSLCETCKYAIRREDQSGKVTIKCLALASFIRTKTLECSQYLHYSQPLLYDLKQISWILKTTGYNKVGFVPFTSLSSAEKESVILS